MCTKVFSAWIQIIQWCIYTQEFETPHVYDASSEDEAVQKNGSSRYNLRSRKAVNYTDDSDDSWSRSTSSRVSSRVSSRGADSRDVSSNDD